MPTSFYAEPQFRRDPQQFTDLEVDPWRRGIRIRHHHLNRIFELICKRNASHDCSLSVPEDFAVPASVLAEGQALRPTTLLNFPGTVLTSFLKYACHWGVYGNSCCGDYTDDVGKELVAV